MFGVRCVDCQLASFVSQICCFSNGLSDDHSHDDGNRDRSVSPVSVRRRWLTGFQLKIIYADAF